MGQDRSNWLKGVEKIGAQTEPRDTPTFRNWAEGKPLKETAKEPVKRWEKTRQVEGPRRQKKKSVSKRMGQVTLLNGAEGARKIKALVDFGYLKVKSDLGHAYWSLAGVVGKKT